ncbi:MAG: ribosome-associated protein [Lysobacterales bacterium]|jgi:ribosome-associated protein
MNFNAPDDMELPPSKSQRKRDARLVFELARDLVAMSNRQLSALPIEVDLRSAIDFAQNIKAHVARKRQVQFIAKMMRSSDVLAIQEAQAAVEMNARQTTVRHHRVEAWRDHLLQGGDEALAQLLMVFEGFDIQALRHLIRNARKESETGKPPATARKLFKLLRDMDSAQDLPPAPE